MKIYWYSANCSILWDVTRDVCPSGMIWFPTWPNPTLLSEALVDSSMYCENARELGARCLRVVDAVSAYTAAEEKCFGGRCLIVTCDDLESSASTSACDALNGGGQHAYSAKLTIAARSRCKQDCFLDHKVLARLPAASGVSHCPSMLDLPDSRLRSLPTEPTVGCLSDSSETYLCCHG